MYLVKCKPLPVPLLACDAEQRCNTCVETASFYELRKLSCILVFCVACCTTSVYALTAWTQM
jgi:hypothetical protein